MWESFAWGYEYLADKINPRVLNETTELVLYLSAVNL